MNSWIQMSVNSNGEEVEVNDTDESIEVGQLNYKQQYLQLKKKLKLLLFENEFFQENLRQNQKRLLKVSKDRSFLLDRLLKYENTETSSEDSETSDDDPQTGGKKRKGDTGSLSMQKKKKIMLKKQQHVMSNSQIDDVAMVERHLEARNSISMPSFTFPQEIFDENDDM